jgi:FkbH-like protein
MTPGLYQTLQSVDQRPTLAAYAEAARDVRLLNEQLRPIRASLLSTFTINSLVPYLEVEAARRGLAANIHVGPFNSVRQELLNPGSQCLSHQPDIVFVAQLLCDVCPPLVNDFLSLDETRIEQYLVEIVSETLAALMAFRQVSQATVVMHNFALPPHPPLGIYEVMEPRSQTSVIRQLNLRLVDAVKQLPGVYVLDYDRLCAHVGYGKCQNDKTWYLGRAPLSGEALSMLASVQSAFMQASVGHQRKCLVLDLDNTLWGGVVGEDGVAGIQLGHTYPGNAFRYFQEVLLQLHRRGVLLAINSMNNEADVEEVFQSHPDMVLRREHFASARMNWAPKPENMMEIANELNIGLDSLVFLDDSPTERALMRKSLPQVLTLEVPKDPLKYAEALMESRAFDGLSFTAEDRRRGEMYREEVAREHLKQSASSLQDFLESLQLEVSIRPVDQFAFVRVLDLIHKTNQFNLTSRRHSAGQLKEIIADPNCHAFYLRVVDRFGDNGIVGAAISRVQDGAVYLDTFLLSCRILGRTIETAFLYFLVEWFQKLEMTTMEAEFIRTAKNAPAADFLSRHCFKQIGEESTSSRWRLDLKDVSFQWPGYIQLKTE